VGGGYDTYSRLIEPFYEKRLGAEIIIENVPGGGGMVGANQIKGAPPDGLALGVLNAPGLLVAALTGETEAPNPAQDFTILGRVTRNQVIWATGHRSPFQTIDDVLVEGQKRPILFAVTEVASISFVNVAVISSWFGFNTEFVTGFPGSREKTLAAMRGEVDVVSFTFESLLDRVEAGDLRPLLQISHEPISSHPSLAGVPVLAGDQGLAAQRAAEAGRNVEEATADALALTNILGAGVLVVAPPGLEAGLFRCLEQQLHETLTDPDFKTAAGRSLDIAGAAAAQAEIQTAAGRTAKFVPIVREAIKKVRR
jgi:tripartite-type tricarboxylate transporter receptor subunit TctC